MVIHQLCRGTKGEEEVWQMLTLADKGNRGGLANADICFHSGRGGRAYTDKSDN